MKKKFFAGIIVLAFLIFSVPVLAAPAITVDGDWSDWCLDLSNDWSDESTWVPSCPGIMFIVEDNNNPNHAGLPGYGGPGIHIIGSQLSNTFYNEPTVTLKSNGMTVSPPWGGEKYDMEALYLKNDASNVYFLIITSIPQGGNYPYGHDDQPGDLALNFQVVPGEEFGYEYGVKLGTANSVGNYAPGTIVFLPDWESRGYVLPETADVMRSPNLPGGDIVGQAEIAYVNMNQDDRGAPNYAIELAIPKTALGLSGNAGLNQVFIADNCQNDHFYTPEFPTVAISFALVVALVFVIFWIKNKKE